MSFTKKLSRIVLIVFLLWLSGFGIFTALALTGQPQDPDKKTDAIVVLTGGEKRVETGLDLLAGRGAAHLFITGVHEGTSIPDILAQWKEKKNLPQCCIDIDRKATSTVENAKNTRAWLETNTVKSIRLVTSNYHMIRASAELRHALPGIEIVLHPVAVNEIAGSKRRFWEVMAIEYHKNILRRAVMILAPRHPLERKSA